MKANVHFLPITNYNISTLHFHTCIVDFIFPQKLTHQSNTHGLQGDDTPVNNRGHRDSGTKGHYTETRRHPPYHFQLPEPTLDTRSAATNK